MVDDHVDAFVEKQTPEVKPIVRRLRSLVRETLPDYVETVDKGHDVVQYGHGTKMSEWLVYISGHKAHANLGFAKGASLPDPDGLVEGTGKRLRHVKVRSLAEAERPGLRRLLEEARKLG